MGRLADQSDATRTRLLDAAQETFAERGYAASALDEIVSRAGVTKGALYYHFPSKEDLFRAVLDRMEADLADRSMTAATAGSDALDMIRLGFGAFLDACLEPAVQRVVLTDAVSVLGWERWHEVGTKYSFALLVAGLKAAMDQGLLERRPVETLAHLLQGAVIRAGMVLAQAEDPKQTRAAMDVEIAALLESIRSPQRRPA
jgi:AcrR family transcriptional regulator